jgi:hypothetical protein
MNAPNTQVALELKRLRQQLSLATTHFADLWQEHGSLWQTMGWNEAQARLYLKCLPGVVAQEEAGNPPGGQALIFQIKSGAAENKAGAFDLADEMVALLSHAGRPMPLAQLINKLPAGLVVTEPMLRSAAQQDPRLELKGPLLKLAH